MHAPHRHVLAIGCAHAAVVLAACSGSGSGAGPSGGGSSGGSAGDAYTVSPTSVMVEGYGGGPRPAAQDIQVVATGATIYVKTELSGAAVESAGVQTTSGQTAVVTIQPASPTAVPDGTSTASVRIVGCKDPVCSGEVAGSPKVVSVTYVKKLAGLTGEPTALAFTQMFGGPAPAAQNVMLHDLGGGSFPWTSSISYQSGSGWLAVTPASGSTLPATPAVSVVPGAATGTNQATLQFAVGTTSVFDVAVTYTVSADFRVMPATMNVVGAFGVKTPDQHLSLTDGHGASYPWTVQVEYDPSDKPGWATISAGSGSSLPADVVVALGTLPDRLTHIATLRVHGGGVEQLVSLSYRTP